MNWVYDIVREEKTGKIVATIFHPIKHPACAIKISKELLAEGNDYQGSRMFVSLKEAQAHWYKITKQTDMIKGLD